MTSSSRKPDLIEALDLAALPTKDQEEILLTLNDLIFRSALARLIARMGDPERDEFSALIARDASEEELTAFLAAKVPSAEAALAEAIDEITDDILAVSPK